MKQSKAITTASSSVEFYYKIVSSHHPIIRMGICFLNECAACRQTAVKFWVMSNEYFIEFARSTSDLICTDAVYVRGSVLDSQSCIRAPRTRGGRVPGAECGVDASTSTHFLSHYAHPDFASPSQQDRESPFCLCVDEIQINQALCKTRLSLTQTPTAFAASTGLESFPRGLNYLG